MNFKQFSADNPAIYLITDGTLNAENFSEKSAKLLKTIKTAVELNINLIQIREKRLSAKLVYELSAEAAQITRNSKTKLLINDRADIALAAAADGVHLTSISLQAEVIRRNFPSRFIIGVSAHSLIDAEKAESQKADFAAFSPVYETPSKIVYGKPQGVNKLREVCEKLKPFPIIALGGINETNFCEVLKNGASGFAAIRFLNDNESLKKAAARFVRNMNER